MAGRKGNRAGDNAVLQTCGSRCYLDLLREAGRAMDERIKMNWDWLAEGTCWQSRLAFEHRNAFKNRKERYETARLFYVAPTPFPGDAYASNPWYTWRCFRTESIQIQYQTRTHK
mmetsp:Transcript_203/g.348  ORF Transcript_203/g.348 Transcript_203/m.348 type:complete len:115 (+) Transcript_203:1244-1588(+)